jgi:hypothetical protein
MILKMALYVVETPLPVWSDDVRVRPGPQSMALIAAYAVRPVVG